MDAAVVATIYACSRIKLRHKVFSLFDTHGMPEPLSTMCKMICKRQALIDAYSGPHLIDKDRCCPEKQHCINLQDD